MTDDLEKRLPPISAAEYHPDILAAHAQFGGDLASMQALYDRPDHLATIAALRQRLAEVEALYEQARSDTTFVSKELHARATAAEAGKARLEAALERAAARWAAYQHYDDDLQKSVGFLPIGQRVAADLRAALASEANGNG